MKHYLYLITSIVVIPRFFPLPLMRLNKTKSPEALGVDVKITNLCIYHLDFGYKFYRTLITYFKLIDLTSANSVK